MEEISLRGGKNRKGRRKQSTLISKKREVCKASSSEDEESQVGPLGAKKKVHVWVLSEKSPAGLGEVKTYGLAEKTREKGHRKPKRVRGGARIC